MNWAMIWAAIQGLISGLSNKDKWKMSIDGTPNAPITDVTVGESGIKFGFNVGDNAVTLEAVPGDATHANVNVNGELDANARMVFSMRHQLLKPLIVVFEFRNVTVDGETKLYRFDNPK